MATGVLLITHGDLGAELLRILRGIIGDLPAKTAAFSPDPDRDIDELARDAANSLAKVDEGGGVLIITDLMGATPANVAARLASEDRYVVAGANVSMLVRVMNYSHLTLEELTQKALSGARDGVIRIHPAETD